MNKKNLISCILVGVVFIAVGIFMMYRENNLKQNCTEKTIGTVVSYEEESEYDEDNILRTTYYPVIEYKVGEKTVSSKSTSGSNQQKYSINDEINILYNPNNKEEFIIENDNTGKIIGIAFTVIGTLALIGGVIMIFKHS